jgi:hypothetical protein
MVSGRILRKDKEFMPKVNRILLNTLLTAGIALNPTDVRATDEKNENNTSQSESSRNTIRLVSTPTFTPSTLDFSSIDLKDSSQKNVQKEKIAQMLGIFVNTTKLRVIDTSSFIHKLYLGIPPSTMKSETENVAIYFQRLAWLHKEGFLDQEMFDVITNCPNQTAISVGINRLIFFDKNIQNGSVVMNNKDNNRISSIFFNEILDYASKPSPPDFKYTLDDVNAIARKISPYLLK